MKKILALMLALCMLLALCACGSNENASATTTSESDEVTTLVFSVHEANNATVCTELLQPWFDRIESESGGRVKIEAHYNAELASADDAYDEVVKGNIDMAFIMQSTMPQCIGDQIIDASFIDNQSTHMSKIYNELYNKYEEMQEPYSDVKVMLLFCFYPNTLTTNKELNSVADLNGQKLIASDSFQSARLEAAGATAVSCMPPDVYSTVEKGVADGAVVMAIPQLISNSWGEVVKYVYDVPLRHPTNGIIMNMDTWNSLPADIQEMIDSLTDEFVNLADTVMVDAVDKGKVDTVEEYGTVIVEPDESFMADLHSVWDSVHDDWIADYDSQGFPASALYDDLVSLVEQYN